MPVGGGSGMMCARTESLPSAWLGSGGRSLAGRCSSPQAGGARGAQSSSRQRTAVGSGQGTWRSGHHSGDRRHEVDGLGARSLGSASARRSRRFCWGDSGSADTGVASPLSKLSIMLKHTRKRRRRRRLGICVAMINARSTPRTPPRPASPRSARRSPHPTQSAPASWSARGRAPRPCATRE